MVRQVADDDITRELYKSIAQINRTNESHKTIVQNKMTSHPGMEMMNDAVRCSRATQIHPSRRGECFKAPC